MEHRHREPSWQQIEPPGAELQRWSTFGNARSPISSYHPLVLIMAAVIGAGAVSIGVYAYIEWRARVALTEVMRTSDEAMQRVRQQIDQQQREAVLRQTVQQAELDRQAAAKMEAVRARQRSEEDARRAALAETDRKDRAWAKFYRRPSSCADSASTECANGFIRARRDFEERYARGEL